MKTIIILSFALLMSNVSFSQDSLTVEPVEKTTDVSGVLITSGLTAIGCSGISWFSSRSTAKVFFIAGGASVVTGFVIRHFDKRKKTSTPN